jgi:hypothetical protein
MKVDETHIIHRNGILHLLYKLENGAYAATSNGAFGQRDTYIEIIDTDEAEMLITKATPSSINGFGS